MHSPSLWPDIFVWGAQKVSTESCLHYETNALLNFFFFHLQNLGLMLTVALLSSYIFTTRTLMSPRLKFPEIQWLLSSKWTSDVRAVFSLFSINCLVSRNTLSCVGYLKVCHYLILVLLWNLVWLHKSRCNFFNQWDFKPKPDAILGQTLFPTISVYDICWLCILIGSVSWDTLVAYSLPAMQGYI